MGNHLVLRKIHGDILPGDRTLPHLLPGDHPHFDQQARRSTFRLYYYCLNLLAKNPLTLLHIIPHL